ncbi:DUF378 domain-containing protein [bacterium]|nr:DUF378 domain-containing protein [bacterium]NDC94046.1 DUF378 domain-containing protein [bacterium]NDD82732.1 DUF378 domain-containing protein [bacterium]NDG29152.1 DUF378 domain-containing protein [bacterium]
MDQTTITQAIQAILIIAAVNWALVAYNGTDLVAMITGPGEMEKYVKYAIGAVGLYAAYTAYM